MSNREHFEVYAGENRTLTLNARDASNAVVSLTGKTVAWYVGRDPYFPDDSSALVTKSGTVTVAASGRFTVALVPADTDDLEGDYEHMAKTTDGSGNVAVVSRGRLRVLPALEV